MRAGEGGRVIGSLTHAHTIVQLIDDSEILVACGVPRNGKGGVVGAHLSDVAIFPVAELGVVVASGSIAHRRRAAGTCGGHCAVRTTHDLGQFICVRGTGDLRV